MINVVLNDIDVKTLLKIAQAIAETPVKTDPVRTEAAAKGPELVPVKEDAKPKAKKKEAEKAPELETEASEETESARPAYDDVKEIVLRVVKELGRDASLDLLEPFGVTSGEGNDRTANIKKLEKFQFEKVIEAAKKILQ